MRPPRPRQPLLRRALPALLCVLLAVPALAVNPLLARRDPVAAYENDHTTWVYPPWEHTWGVVRGTQTHLAILTLGRAHFRNPQGLCAVRLAATDDPEKKGDDDEVTVYGVNSGENSLIYNKSMHSLGLYGYKDLGEGNLLAPWDVAALPDGQVFVTDSGHHRVVKLRNVKGELRYEGSFGAGPPASLILPRGIAATWGGRVLVADARRNRVVLFDTSGAFLDTIGGFLAPVALAAVDREDPWLRPPGEYFVVGDSGGARLSKMSFDGRLIARVSVPGAAGLAGAHVGHVDIDLYHDVIATDSVHAKLLKFDSQLDFLAAWGQEGVGRTRFTGPTGITVWRRFGQTFVAERNGAHYLWVGTDLAGEPELRVRPRGPAIELGLRITERSEIRLELVDGKGNVVREKRTVRRAGDNTILWRLDLKGGPLPWSTLRSVKPTPKPAPLPAGEYGLRLRLRATYSSKKVFEKVVETRVVLPEAAPTGGQ